MLIFADNTTILACGEDPTQTAQQLTHDLEKIPTGQKVGNSFSML